MNYLEHAYTLTRKEWIESLERIKLSTDPDALNQLLLEIQKDHDAFHHILKQRELFDAIEDKPEGFAPLQVPTPVEESESIAEPAPVVEEPEEIPSLSYRINRLFKGAEAHRIGVQDDYIYLNEAACLRHDLQTGSVIRGKMNIHNTFLNIEEVLTKGNPNDNRFLHIYSHVVVMKDKGGALYINRHQDGRFMKNHNDELVRHNPHPKEIEHFQLKEGDIVNVTENRSDSKRLVTFLHDRAKDSTAFSAEPKAKPKTKTTPPLTPEERREKLFKPLPATPDIVLDRKVAIIAPGSLHKRLTDDLELLLGMRLTLLDDSYRDSQIESAFRDNEFVLVSLIETSGSLYKKMLQWAKDYDTNFRPVEHGGVSSMLRAIVDMLFEKEYAHSF